MTYQLYRAPIKIGGSEPLHERSERFMCRNEETPMRGHTLFACKHFTF